MSLFFLKYKRAAKSEADCVCVCVLCLKKEIRIREIERGEERRGKNIRDSPRRLMALFFRAATRQDQRKGTIIKRKARASLLFPLSPASFTLRAEKNQGSGPNRGFAIRF